MQETCMVSHFYIRTFGCQMNLYDSWLVEDFLMKAGFVPVNNLENADIAIFNTCTVRQHAEDRALSHIGRLKLWKRKNPNRKVIVMGCVVERLKDELMKRFPFIDIAIGAKEIEDFHQIFSSKLRINGEMCTNLNLLNINRKVSAFVAISRGCNNYCSYCIVPYVRGELKTRSLNEILNEISALARNGIKEVTLLGQNVNAYFDPHDRNIDFAQLLIEVNKIKPLKRIRFLTNHPKDMTQRLIDTMASLEKVCEHIHLPVQSGSDRILKLMNRGYTRKQYEDLVKQLRKAIKNISITTDLIVGFPTETDTDFNDTISLVKEIEFDSAFCFKYSPRDGTESAKFFKDDVPKEVKEERLQRLLELTEKIALEKNKKLINTIQEIMINEISNGNAIGKTRTNKETTFKAKNTYSIGDIVNVKIVSVAPHKLFGS